MAAPDPIAKFQRWFAQARRAGVALPDKFALASVDRRGRPSVRYVLLKTADERGFVFYTNVESRKGRELDGNPHASMAFYWHETDHQVRVEGRVRRVSDAEAEAYWQERPRESQLASTASRQSRTVASRSVLVAQLKRLTTECEGIAVARPERWTGYRLKPQRIEFWTRKEPRLHHRELYTRTGDGWRMSILQP
jgi:pyridoxamine 5'-phosphate oxidase